MATKKIMGNPVIWGSEKGNIVVTYNQFGLGGQYNIYHKVLYVPENVEGWEYHITFDTSGEAFIYAAKMYDCLVER